MTMKTTTLDFAPLFRTAVGFDRVFALLDNASRGASPDNWPPYDITKTGEHSYSITMAVAGFGLDDLTITHQPNLLVVGGRRAEDDQADYLYRGIAARAFERRFELADHVQVRQARLENGLLKIDLAQEIPEAMKPRRIAIGSGSPTSTLAAASTRRIVEEKEHDKVVDEKAVA
jgi:molecular chaperone IbpA